MPKTLLQIVQAAQAELGLPQASTVIGNSDPTTTQMLALAQRCLDEIRRCHPTGWTAMQFEYDLIVNVPTITNGNIAAQSAVITNIPSTTGILANFFTVSGQGIPVASRVQSVDSPTQITMTMEGTNTQAIAGIPLTFAQDTYPAPPGFDWLQNRTMWDRTNRWELLGPDSPQIDQWHRSGIVATGPRRHFRKLGPYSNVLRIWPQPVEITSPLQLVFEYLSLYAVMVHGSYTAFSQYFVYDDDQPVLDDQAIIMGIKWMFWEAKGFGSYATLQSRWVDYVERLIGRDGAAPTLQLARRASSLLVSSSNVQDGNWPGFTGPNMS